MAGLLDAEFIDLCFQNPSNKRLFGHLVKSGLPHWVITSGCLFQTVWNVQLGRPPAQGILDYDVFYFDQNLSWASEDVWISKFSGLSEILSAPVELRNQARVHLWYEEKFDHSYPPLLSVFDGIDRFLERVAMVGIYASKDGRPELYAPGGLDDVYGRIVRPTYAQDLPEVYAAKAARLVTQWPDVTVMPWLSCDTKNENAGS